jgi:hypothetical protein
MYRQSQNGLLLNTADPQLLPRYLHFLVAAVAVTGMTIGCFGLYWYNRERAYGQWLIRTGATIYLALTLLQIPVGLWFFLSLTKPVQAKFLGGDPVGAGLFIAALVLDVLGLICMGLAMKQREPGAFKVGLASGLIVIFLMVILRHLLRVYALEGIFTADPMPVRMQWFLLTLFFGSFIAGVGYIAWLLRLTWRAYHAKSQADHGDGLLPQDG